MKAKYITLMRLASHDFGRSLRAWRNNSSPEKILDALVKERTRALGDGFKALGLAIVLMLWLQAQKSELSLTLSLVQISIPSSYVVFVMAFCVMGFLIGLTGYFVLNEFIRVASSSLFRFDAPWMLTVPFDGSGAWSSPLLLQFRYFRSSGPHSILAIGTLVVLFVPFVIVLLALYWTLIRVGFTTFSNRGALSFDGWLTIASWLIAAFPLLNLILVFTPFRFEKNTEFIRWNLLYRMWKRAGLRPRRVEHWLT